MSGRKRPEKRRYPADDNPRPQKPTARTGCPTPAKTAYASNAAALHAQISLARAVGSARAYLCPCGKWHLTKMTRTLTSTTGDPS